VPAARGTGLALDALALLDSLNSLLGMPAGCTWLAAANDGGQLPAEVLPDDDRQLLLVLKDVLIGSTPLPVAPVSPPLPLTLLLLLLLLMRFLLPATSLYCTRSKYSPSSLAAPSSQSC
jgi:hypothetical protein